MGRSKEAKKRRHDKRMARRRAVKAAKRAAYMALIGTSGNRKRKVSAKVATASVARERRLVPVVSKGSVILALRSVHGGADCGNLGCRKCFPHLVKVA